MSKYSRPKKISFTDEEDEQLIEHISCFQYIWDMKHADYKNGYKKDQVWQEIADKLKRKRDECQARWKSIRDHYKRQRKEDRTGFTAKKRRVNYWDRLSFLDTTEDERNTFYNISVETLDSAQNYHQHAEQDVINDTSSSVNEFEVPPYVPDETIAMVEYFEEKKDQSTQCNDSIKGLLESDEQDDVDLFFKSIAMTVKKFQPHLVSKTKLKVLEVVTDMEELHYKEVDRLLLYPSELSNQSSHQSLHSSTLTSSQLCKSELSN